MYELKLFSGNANRPLAEEIAKTLQLPLGDADVSRFSDGEVYVQINENVRGQDVFVIQPTCPPVNDHLMDATRYVVQSGAARAKVKPSGDGPLPLEMPSQFGQGASVPGLTMNW